MPELPEVETARRAVHKAVVGHKIQEVRIQDDAIVYEDVPASVVKKHLAGRTVVGSARRGKHLWVELDQRPWLLFHFGMTGWLHVYDNDGQRPKFWKLELVMENGKQIAYTDPRRLGRIRFRSDPLNEPPISLLGFDPVHNLISLPAFTAELAKRRAPVKAVLLDQSFSAGVGNWIADEVLYQSNIDPRRLASSLGGDEVKKVRQRLRSIVTYAVKVGSDDAKFPKNWLFHYRWGKTMGAVDGRGKAISFTQVGGRTTAWVPAVQK
jgi:formamidopyrimidine-DNA glycosylase